MPSFIAYSLIGVSFLGALTFIYEAKEAFTRDLNAEQTVITKPAAPHDDRAWVELYFGDARMRVFEGYLEGKTYPLALALESVADAGNFTYRIREGKLAKIAGVGDEGGEWIIYRNQQRERTPIHTLIITSGDRYTLRYEKK